MADIKDKIKKLLALAGSPNEHEAKSALLKARRLMAENKIEMEDIEDKEVKLIHIKCEEMTWTTDSGNSWMTGMAKVICDNYCCTSSWMTKRGTRTHVLQITGLEDDANICYEVMKYAIGFINNEVKILERKHRNLDKKTIMQSYASGFIVGLEFAFEEQNETESNCFDLVLVKPQEVIDYEATLGNRSVRTRKVKIDQLAYMKGQNDGIKFNAQKILPA